MTSFVYAFRPGERTKDGFIRLLDKLSAQADLLVPGVSENAAESIHAARTLIKRARFLLWFAKPVLDSGTVTGARKYLRNAAHLLAFQRDKVVTQSILKKLQIRSLGRNKNGDTSKKHEASLRAAVPLLLEALAEIRKAASGNSAKWPSPSDRLAKAFRLARKAEKKALRKGDNTHFHAWRKKAKRLLYQFELTQIKPTTKSCRTIKKVDKLQHKTRYLS